MDLIPRHQIGGATGLYVVATWAGGIVGFVVAGVGLKSVGMSPILVGSSLICLLGGLLFLRSRVGRVTA